MDPRLPLELGGRSDAAFIERMTGREHAADMRVGLFEDQSDRQLGAAVLPVKIRSRPTLFSRTTSEEGPKNPENAESFVTIRSRPDGVAADGESERH